MIYVGGMRQEMLATGDLCVVGAALVVHNRLAACRGLLRGRQRWLIRSVPRGASATTKARTIPSPALRPLQVVTDPRQHPPFGSGRHPGIVLWGMVPGDECDAAGKHRPPAPTESRQEPAPRLSASCPRVPSAPRQFPAARSHTRSGATMMRHLQGPPAPRAVHDPVELNARSATSFSPERKIPLTPLCVGGQRIGRISARPSVAVSTARKPMPSNMTAIPIIRPATVLTTMSP